MPQCKSFYELLQGHPELDLRDNRGKRHDLPLVLLGVSLSLFRGRDGTLSGIHRSMKHFQSKLCECLSINYKEVVSRSQLPLILEKVDVVQFSKLLKKRFGVKLDPEQRQWFGVDGKELRGSIQKGNKRGEAIVHAVSHEGKQSIACHFFNGRKASEKPAVRKLLSEDQLLTQAISLDALHFAPATLHLIAQAKGWYLVGLKDNQKELYQDMLHHTQYMPHKQEFKQIEKGHGRIETRHYKAFSIEKEYVDKRWKKAQFRTLIEVLRTRTEFKTAKTSSDKALYIANLPVEQASELFRAVRNHWAVESNNYCRDVTLAEDKLRSKKVLYSIQWLF